VYQYTKFFKCTTKFAL